MPDSKKLLDAVLAQDPNAFKNEFNDQMMNRLGDALEDKRLEMAANLFASPSEIETEIEEPEDGEKNTDEED